MKSIEFCYWLQGWFELTDPKSISPEKTDMIKSHLALVMKYDTQPYQFCHSLNGLFTIAALTEFNEVQTQKLKKSLSETFLNTIDTRYTKEEHQKLDMIHHSQETLTIEEIHNRANQRNRQRGSIGIGQRMPNGSVAKC